MTNNLSLLGVSGNDVPALIDYNSLSQPLLEHWDTNGLVEDEGSGFSELWQGKNGNDLTTNSQDFRRPIYPATSYPSAKGYGAQFDGLNDGLWNTSFNTSGALTIIAVAMSLADQTKTICGTGYFSGDMGGGTYGTNLRRVAASDTVTAFSGFASIPSTTYTFKNGLKAGADTIKCPQNEISVFVGTSTASIARSTFAAGASLHPTNPIDSFWNGVVYEILVFGGVLTDEEIYAIDASLRWQHQNTVYKTKAYPVIHHDPSDTSTIGDTSGAMDSITDNSDYDNDGAATLTERPTTDSETINSLNALSFDGNDLITIGTSTSLDNMFDSGGGLIMAFQPTDTSTGGGARIFDIAEKVYLGVITGDRLEFVQTTDGTNWVYRSVNDGDKGLLVEGEVVTLEVFYDSSTPSVPPVIRKNGISMEMYVDITGTGTVDDTTGDDLIIFNNAANEYGMIGLLGEHFWYNKETNYTSIRYIREYLQAKWATITLTTLSMASTPDIAIGTAVKTYLGRILGRTKRATLSAAPSTLFSMKGEQLLKGSGEFSFDGNQYMQVTETLSGANNTPNTTDILVNVTRGTPQMGDFWSIDTFKDWIMQGFLTEDLPLGKVEDFAARGASPRDASQSTESLQATKLSDGSLHFEENSGQHYDFTGEKDAHQSYRASLIIFKIAGATGTDTETILLGLNDGAWAAGYPHTKVTYHKTNGITVTWRGRRQSGVVTYQFKSTDVVDDGAGWNVLLTYERWGRLYCSLNGEDLGRPTNDAEGFLYERRDNPSASILGDSSTGNIEWWTKGSFQLDSILSEAMVEKIEGWLMHTYGVTPPAGHTYENAAPVVDEEDYPALYRHTEAYQELHDITRQYANSPARFDNRGESPVDDSDYETVWITDYTQSTYGGVAFDPISSDDAGLDLSYPWYAPLYWSGIERDAEIDLPWRTSITMADMYPLDTGAGELELALDNASGTTYGCTMATVDPYGYGMAFHGEAIYRTEFKMPDETPRTGCFPAPIWAYGTELLRNRAIPYRENDFIELTGESQEYLNGFSVHVHKGNHAGYNGNPSADYPFFKLYGNEVENSVLGENGGVGNLDFWDGVYRVYEARIDNDWTYFNMGIDGSEVELYRVPTCPAFLYEMFLLSNYALELSGGRQDLLPATRTTMTFKKHEVLYKTSRLAEYKLPFTDLPVISGTAQVGQTLTCTPNVQGVTDLRYFWLANGILRQRNSSSQYTCIAEDEGKQIRCLVLAVGHRILEKGAYPQAWSIKTDAVIAP